MTRRQADIVVSLLTLIAISPLLIVVSLIILLVEGAPVFYAARRTGLAGKEFTLWKFRTMKLETEDNAGLEQTITRPKDTRVFPLGYWLRLSKIDELPQLYNVLAGQMSLFGPRPEDPDIVAHSYTTGQRVTLDVVPGILSPGSLFNYTHGDQLLAGENTLQAYLEKVLPAKLAMDILYIQRRNLQYDLSLALRCFVVVFAKLAGRREFKLPPEYVHVKNSEKKGDGGINH